MLSPKVLPVASEGSEFTVATANECITILKPDLSADDAGLVEEIMHVPWPIPIEYSEEGRYNTLLQISIGQEEVDDVITRDIHRTFPEHPQFGNIKGQQLLFKVLKAYSLHDLEVILNRTSCS